jgi:putative methionine-R-sulfoxide reductase with GAF domain
MHAAWDNMTTRKSELYRNLAEQLGALLAGERDPIANAANMAALIYHGLPDLNWAGFYFRQDGELVLGPFQGRSRSAKECAVPQPHGPRRFWSRTFTIFRVISRAIRPRARSWSCH